VWRAVGSLAFPFIAQRRVVCLLHALYAQGRGKGRFGPYKILPILFYCNKGGRRENLLRNIVGNKGGLGGGYCTITH